MTAVLAALGAGLLVVLGTAARLILENEYPSWASALARGLVGLAGWVHPRRRDEWVADVLYLQRQGKTGLWEAAAYLVGAPWLTLRRFAIQVTPTQVAWPEANAGGALVFALGAGLAYLLGAVVGAALVYGLGAQLSVTLASMLGAALGATAATAVGVMVASRLGAALAAQLADRVGAGLVVLLTVMVGAGLGVVLADGLAFGIFVGLVFGMFVGLVFGLARRAAPAEARAGLSREGAQA